MSLLNISYSFSGSVAISQKLQDKSFRRYYIRTYDHLVFPGKGGNPIVTLEYNGENYWCVLLNVPDTFIPETTIEGTIEAEIIIRKILEDRHFMLARAQKLVIRYQETREETEHENISDRIEIAEGLYYSKTLKRTYKRTYEITFDVINNNKTERLISEELIREEESTNLELSSDSPNSENVLDDLSLFRKYSKYSPSKILRHAVFSKYIVHKRIESWENEYRIKDKWYKRTIKGYVYSDIHDIHELRRELTIDDILELSKAYIIVLRHIVVPLRSSELHIHLVAYNGQLFQIYSDQYIFGESTILAKNRYLTLSQYYRKKFPRYIYVDEPEKLLNVLEKIRSTKLQYNSPSAIEQLYEIFYERRPREQKRKYIDGYFEIYEKIYEITKGKTRLLISFPNAYRFRVFKLRRLKNGIVKVRAYRNTSRIPSQLWIRGKFLKEYIKSRNLQDYIHFLFMGKQKKLEILKKHYREFIKVLGINPMQFSDMSWEAFVDYIRYTIEKSEFLNAIHEYFVKIEKNEIYPRHVKKEEIMRAYDRFLFALKNYKLEKLLEPDILKWIRAAIKYYLRTKHDIKPKAGLVLTGGPTEILRKIFEKVQGMDDKDFIDIVVSKMTKLEIYNVAVQQDEELKEIVEGIKRGIVLSRIRLG